jgi:hypothetical protein
MPKVCTSCGFTDEQPVKPDEEPEDCKDCGEKGTMRKEEEAKEGGSDT